MRVSRINLGEMLLGVSFVSAGLSALTSTWGGLRPGGLQLVDFFLAASLLCAFMGSVAQGKVFLAVPRSYMICVAWFVCVVMLIGLVNTPTLGFLDTRVQLTPRGDSMANGVASGIQWLVAQVMLPLCVMALGVWRKWTVRLIGGAWVWSAIISSCVAILDATGVASISHALIGLGADTGGREAGLASHANSLGVSAAMAIPLCLVTLRRNVLLEGLSLAVLLAGVLLSGGRGAQVASLCALIGGLLYRGTRNELVRSLRVLIPAVVLGGWLLFGTSMNSQEGAYFRFGGEAGGIESDRGRLLLAGQALEDFQQHPLGGIGLGNITYAHSIYLQLLSAGGVVMAIGFFLYMAGLFRDVYLCRGDQLAVAAGGTLLVWLGVGIVENNLVDRYLYFPCGVVAALALLAGGPRRDASSYVEGPEAEGDVLGVAGGISRH